MHYPTILVSIEDGEFLSVIVQQLRQEGYLVLEAGDDVAALRLARTHSRPIHLMLIHTSMNHGVLASELKQYRRESKILLIAEHRNEPLSDDVLTQATVLPKVRAFFEDSSTSETVKPIP